MEKQEEMFHYLVPGKVKRLLVQKKDRAESHAVYLETVEISPSLCCFEGEGEQSFDVGDELHFHFLLDDRSLSARAAVLQVDRCKFLDECYERKVWYLYCARFEGELDKKFFSQMVGAPRLCPSSTEF
jgi:hypothetical protein